MKKITLLFFIICFTQINICQSQTKGKNAKLFNQELTASNKKSIEETGQIRCGTVEYENYLQETNINRTNKAEFEKWLAPKIEDIKAQRANSPTVIITIPVVYHIFTDGSGSENLSAAAIQAQTDQLNIDFGNTAGSTYSVAADTEIRFCLALQDENGIALAEDGINRITTYGEGPFTTADFESGMKADTQWDPTQYFNVWVANLNGGLLGYAHWPENTTLSGVPANSAGSTSDGVVVLSSSVGSIANPNPNGGVYASGRTLTHETGHWLGLRHIWGDTTACSNDDYCSDTPDATESHGGCSINTDTCDLDGLGNDMVENYMDYSDDTCMHTFTADQKARIQAVMANSPRRVELASSDKCTPGLVYDLDGQIEIDDLNLVDCATNISPDIILTNQGNLNITSATIVYDIDNNNAINYTWTGNLANGESEVISLPSIDLDSGNHIFNVELSNPNGGIDDNITNNTDSSNSFSAFFDTTTITFDLIPDNYGSETTWEFKDSNNVVLYSGSNYPDSDNTPVSEVFDVTIGECYTFTINDSFGDGICCLYGLGSYTLSDDNSNIITTGGEFSSTESITFGVNSLSTNDFELQNSINIYPNPTVSSLNIKTSNSNDLPNTYKVYNMLGQLVLEKAINTTQDLTIDTTPFSNGMYFIKISKDGNAATFPFIKK